MPDNTDAHQNADIRAAKNATHVDDLIAIIGDLDSQITQWKDASKFDLPRDLEIHLKEQDSRIEELKSELEQARDRYEAIN